MSINIEDCKAFNKGDNRRTASVYIRLTPRTRKWLVENRISPTRLFHEALKEIKCPEVQEKQD